MTKRVLLLLSEAVGDRHIYVDEHVAASAPAQVGNTLACQPEDCARLGPGRHIDVNVVAFKERHPDHRAERGLSHAKPDRVVEIGANPLETGIR